MTVESRTVFCFIICAGESEAAYHIKEALPQIHLRTLEHGN